MDTTLWTWEGWFVFASGIGLAMAFINLAAGILFKAKNRFFPAAVICLGLSLFSYLEGAGIAKDLDLIPYAYALLVILSSLMPWAVLKLLKKDYVLAMLLLPLSGLLISAFVFSNAFPNSEELSFGCYNSLTIKWAFWLSAGTGAIIPLITGIWGLKLTLKPGNRNEFRKAGVLTLGLNIFAVFIILQSVSDCKLVLSEIPWAAFGALAMAFSMGLMPLFDFLEARRSLKLCERNLERQQLVSSRDPLTGLFNRAYFFEILNSSIERLRRDREFFGLILVDLDDFKQVNDRFGHPAGDYCLAAVGKVIMRYCRAYDCPARYGGDEFIVLISHHMDMETLTNIASRMMQGLNNLVLPYGETEIRIKATMGAMLVDDGSVRIDELLEKVDKALYEGKHSGKGKLVLK